MCGESGEIYFDPDGRQATAALVLTQPELYPALGLAVVTGGIVFLVYKSGKFIYGCFQESSSSVNNQPNLKVEQDNSGSVDNTAKGNKEKSSASGQAKDGNSNNNKKDKAEESSKKEPTSQNQM